MGLNQKLMENLAEVEKVLAQGIRDGHLSIDLDEDPVTYDLVQRLEMFRRIVPDLIRIPETKRSLNFLQIMLGVYWGLDFADRDDYTDAKEKAILNLAQLKENILRTTTRRKTYESLVKYAFGSGDGVKGRTGIFDEEIVKWWRNGTQPARQQGTSPESSMIEMDLRTLARKLLKIVDELEPKDAQYRGLKNLAEISRDIVLFLTQHVSRFPKQSDLLRSAPIKLIPCLFAMSKLVRASKSSIPTMTEVRSHLPSTSNLLVRPEPPMSIEILRLTLLGILEFCKKEEADFLAKPYVKQSLPEDERVMHRDHAPFSLMPLIRAGIKSETTLSKQLAEELDQRQQVWSQSTDQVMRDHDEGNITAVLDQINKPWEGHQEKRINIYKVRHERLLEVGEGGYATIYTAAKIPENSVVAVKAFKMRQHDNEASVENRMLREAKVWKQIEHHENIISLDGFCYGIIQTCKLPNLVMPFYPRGDLRNFIRNSLRMEPNMMYKKRLDLLHDAINGLVFLHDMRPPIVHGDLRGRNILVDPNIRALLSDFGKSDTVDEINKQFSQGLVTSNLRYQPYEFVMSDEPQPKTPAYDMYTFGCLIFETFLNIDPYDSVKTDWKLLRLKGKGVDPLEQHITDAGTKTLVIQSGIGYQIESLMKRCFDTSAKARITARDARVALDRIRNGL